MGNPVVPNAQGDAATTAALKSQFANVPGLQSMLNSQSMTGNQLASVTQFQGQAAIPANSLVSGSLPTNVDQQRQLLQRIQQANGSAATAQTAQSGFPPVSNLPPVSWSAVGGGNPGQTNTQNFLGQQPNTTYPASTQQQMPMTGITTGISTGSAAGTTATLAQAGTSSQEMFDQALNDALPMSPQQIRATKQRMLQTQRAAVGYYVVPPKPVSTSLTVDLAPGAQPPVIRLGQGFVSSLVFVDVTGAPWPIELSDLGNPSAFNLQWDKTGKSNTIMAQALTSYTFGNLAVKLVGLNTPVMLTLIPGQKSVDYRVDLHIAGRGPNAETFPIEGLPQTEGHELVTVLEGIAPAGSKALHVKGGQAQAWLLDGRIYLRTRMTLLSPGWLATVSSADGMRAYMLQRTPHVLISQNGKTVQLKLEGL